MPGTGAAASSTTQHTKAQPWKAAWPPTNPKTKSARPRTLTTPDGHPRVDLCLALPGRNSDPPVFSDLLADVSHWRED